jgi:hypothetical protein
MEEYLSVRIKLQGTAQPECNHPEIHHGA